jgi:hypothetical protein
MARFDMPRKKPPERLLPDRQTGEVPTHIRHYVWLEGASICECRYGLGIRLLLLADVIEGVWSHPLLKEALWSWIKLS